MTIFYRILTRLKNHTFGKFPHLSYSRSGEDLIIEEILGSDKFSGFYVDVGAFHPVHFSNTFKYYLRRWSGINIDANDDTIKLFNKHRKRDINLSVAIGEKEGEATFYLFNEDSSVNTLSEKFKEDIIRNFKYTVKEERKVKVSPLEKILDQYVPNNTAIDLLSVDVEGYDHIVLKTNNWTKYRPKLIVVETDLPVTEISKSEVTIFLQQQDYRPVAYSLVTMDAGNIYFVDNKWISNK